MTRVNIRRPARAQAFALAALFIVSTMSPLISSFPATSPVALASPTPAPRVASGRSRVSPLTQAASSTSVSCLPSTTPAPSGSAGSSTTCTATVSGASPTGTVTFTSSSSTGTFAFGVSFGASMACTLSSGSCFVSYADSATGTPTITATYGGDANNLASTGNFALTVSGTVTLTLSPSSGLAGATVTISGSGFAAGAPISVDFAGGSVSTSGTCVTSSTSGSLGVLPASNGCAFVVPSTAQALPVVTAFDDVGDAASTAFTMSTTKVPVSLTLTADSQSAPVGASNYFTVTYTYSGTSTSVNYVGSPLSFQADANTNVQISATTSGSSSGDSWCLSFSASSCQATTFGTGASGATETYYYYELLTEPVAYTLLGGGSYTPPSPPQAPSVSYTTAPSTAGSSDAPLTIGSPGIGGQVLPNTPAFDFYVLKGTTATVNEYLGGAGSGEQWVLSSATAVLGTVGMVPVGQWTVTAAGQIDNPMNFQHQYQVSFASSPSAGGTTTPSGASVWEDAGTPGVSISATANTGYSFSGWSASTGSITFASAGSASTTATIGGAGTITASFASSAPSQTQVSITLTADSAGTTPLGPTNFFTVTYTSGGVSTTADYTGSALLLTVDQSTTVTISAATSTSNTGEMWCLTGPAAPGNVCGDGAIINVGTSPVSASYYYYDLVAEPSAYLVLDGGSPSAPSVTYTTAPSVFTYGTSPPSSDSPLSVTTPLSLYNPSAPPTLIYALRGTSVSVPDAVAGGTGEQWVVVSSTATVSGGSAVWTAGGASSVDDPIDYYHQYQVTFAASPGAGGTTTPSGTSVWEDASTLSISATANTGYAFTGWSSSSGSITFASTSSASTTATISASGTITADFGLPSIALNPSSGPAGTSTQVTGSGFPASTQFDLCMSTSSSSCSGSFPSGTATTDGSGSVASCSVTPPGGTATPCSVIVPAGTAVGTYYVVLLSKAGPALAFAQFTVTSGAVTFTETGLPASTSWGLTFNGAPLTSSSTSLTTGTLSVGSYSWTVTAVSCGTGCQYAPSPGSGSTSVPAGSAVAITFTKQYSLSVSYSVSIDGSAATLPAGFTPPTLSYTSDGSPATVTLTTSAAAVWVDSGTTWSATNPLTGSGSSERLEAATPSGTASASAAVVVTYYEQWHTTVNLLPAGSSTPISSPNCFTIGYTSVGAAAQAQQCSQALSEWMDAGSGAGGLSVTGSSSGSTSSEEWCIDPTCATVGITVQGTQLTPTLYYYDLLLQTVQYSAVGGAPTVPVALSYSTIPGGGSVNGNPTTDTLDLTSAPQTVWALRGTTAAAPLKVSGGTGIRWYALSSATVASGQLTWTVSAANVVDNPIYYYEQFQLTLSYAVLGGGSPTAPTFAAANLTGSSSVTLPLSPSVKLAWFNSGATYSSTNPLVGSTSSERWQALHPSGTVSSSSTIDVTYNHQYLIDFAFTGTGTVTINGDLWENATAQVTIGATPTAPADFLQWAANSSSLVFGDPWTASTYVYAGSSGKVTGSFGVPTLGLKPTFGPSGTPVSLSGVNYTSDVTYYYCFESGVTSSPAACSSAHTVQVSIVSPGVLQVAAFAVPAGSATGLFVVSSGATGLVVASALFTVTAPSVTVSPTSGTAGVSFSFGASGLAPGLEYETCLAYGASGPPSQGCQPTIYAIGGQDGTSTALGTVEAFNPALNSWSAVASLPTPVTNATAFSIGGLVYVAGGLDAAGSPVSYTQVYDPATNSWSLTAAYPSAVSGLASASNGVKGFAFGGTGASGSTSTLDILYPSLNCWTGQASCSPTAASLPQTVTASAAAYLDGLVYSVGGTGGPQAAAYNVTANCWSGQVTCPPMSLPSTAAAWLAASADGGLLYSFGGTVAGGSPTSLMQVYDPATNLWANGPSLGVATTGLASAEAGGQIYAAGGRTAGGYTNALETFNPLLNVWTSAPPMPTARAGLAMAVVFTYPDGPASSGSYVTGSSGDLQSGLTAQLPSDNAPGTYYLVVSLGSQLVGYSSYTVTSPAVSISSSQGPPGATVTLTGSGFSPDQAYDYCLAASNLQACASPSDTFTSTASGAVPGSTTLTVPSSDAGGLYYVVVSMDVYPPPSFPTVAVFLASQPFTVAPTMSLGASSGQAGSTFSLTAGGLQPSTQYAYCFSPTLTETCAQQGIAVVDVSSGASGSISATVTVPASASPAGPFYFLLETTAATPAIAASAQFVVTAQVSTVTQTTGGSTSVNDSSVTGTSVDITGSTATDGTSATVTTTVLGSQPTGTSGSILTSVGYYDVHVVGLTDGTAQVCIENPSATQFSSMQYYDTGTSSWVDATPITFTAPDTLCGTIPVADLTGTPVLLGAQPVSVSFAETGVSSDSTGVALTVDGVSYSASELPVTFSWLPGSAHTYSWSATVPTTAVGKRYAWSSTSGSGVTAMSGTVSAPSLGGTVTGTFATQYYLGETVSGSGSVSPPEGWFAAGAAVSLAASASSGYAFSAWTGTGSGSYTGTSNPAQVTVTGPVNETAAFVQVSVPHTTYGVTVTETGLPAGTPWQATFEGVTLSSTSSSMSFSGVPSGTSTWSVPTVAGSASGVRYAATMASGSLDVPTQTTVDVTFVTQYLVSIEASPAGSGSVTPAGGWFNASSLLSLSAAPASGYSFSAWNASAGLSVSALKAPSATVDITTYGTITALFAPIAPVCTTATGEDCQIVVSSGSASANETATGVFVEITGSTSPDGTLLNITTAGRSATPPAGVAAPNLAGASYYDVRVLGSSTGTAKVCFSIAGLPSDAAMEYWNGGAWVIASAVSVGTGSVCGQVPVSALSGTPFAIGSPVPTVTTTTTATTTATTTTRLTTTTLTTTTQTSTAKTTTALSSTTTTAPSPSTSGGATSATPAYIPELVAALVVVAVAAFIFLRKGKKP